MKRVFRKTLSILMALLMLVSANPAISSLISMNEAALAAVIYPQGALSLTCNTDLSGVSVSNGDTVWANFTVTNVGETVMSVPAYTSITGLSVFAYDDIYMNDTNSSGNWGYLQPGQSFSFNYGIVISENDTNADYASRTINVSGNNWMIEDQNWPMTPDSTYDGDLVASSEWIYSNSITLYLPVWQPAPGSADDIVLTKSSNTIEGYAYPEGFTVKYYLNVANVSANTVTDIFVYDYMFPEWSYTIPSLEPGASINIEMPWHVINDADLEYGGFENQASAEWGTGVTADGFYTSSNIVNVATGVNTLKLTKAVQGSSENPNGYRPGETVYYNFTAENYGDSDIYDVVITDPYIWDEPIAVISVLESGASMDYGTYYIVPEDYSGDSFTNQAFAEYVGSDAYMYHTASNSVTIPVIGNNPTSAPTVLPTGMPTNAPTRTPDRDNEKTETVNFSIEKALGNPPERGYFVPGEKILYYICVTNTGSNTVSNATVIDPLYSADLTPIDVPTLASGESTTLTYEYTVKLEDTVPGYVDNTATLCVPDGGGSLTFVSNTVRALVGLDDTIVVGNLKISKSVSSTPANGMFYTPGEVVTFDITLKNETGMECTSVDVYDILIPGSGLLFHYDSIPVDFQDTLSLDYTVTEADAYATFVSNIAAVTGIDSNGSQNIDISDPVRVDTGFPDTPFGVITELTITKVETSTPKNASYYTEGETITYEITYTNTGETDLGEVIIYDSLKYTGSGEIASAEMLHTGESRTCTFEYVVSASDVAAGYVYNEAIAQFYLDSYLNTVISNPVISDTDGNADSIDTITKKIELPVNDGTFEPCKRTLITLESGEVVYEQHYCSEHLETQNAIMNMISVANTDDAKLKTWQYARMLWEQDLDEMYTELLEAASPAARSAVMNERILFNAQLACKEALLTEMYPDQPALVAEEIAEMLMNRCTDLCYVMHTAPQIRVDSYKNVKMVNSVLEGNASCTFDVLDNAGDVTFAEKFCDSHGITATLANSLVVGSEYSADSWNRAASLWNLEMDTACRKMMTSASDERTELLAAAGNSYISWLNARSGLLTLLYPDQPDTISELYAKAIQERVIELCELNK